MLPANKRRNITIDGVLWHYLIRYEGVTVQNTETNELIDWNAGKQIQVTPALVSEVIRTNGNPEGFTKVIPKKFITTTLPYANSVPHIGHALEFILGDALARFFRTKLGDENVHFNIGLDEHGKKIYDAALSAGSTPKEYLDELNVKWKDFCSKFGVEYNSFYRTSHKSHHAQVSKFWTECKQKGLIYKRPYVGNYCVGCESFKLEKDLVDGKCPDHSNTEIQLVEEENYFFALTKYKKELLRWFETSAVLKPESKREELRLFLEDIQDISVSRKRESVPWGVPVPDDSSQVIYVWFDALLNYILVAGYYEDKPCFEQYWKDTVQLFGPDNLKFQAAIFQGLLCAAGTGHTGALLCHGTILDKDGRKMSKTVGNVIDPIDQLEKYGIDAVRYYALSGINTYGNSVWSEVQLVNTYNAHLADVYGNLVARVTHLLSTRENWNRYSIWNRELFQPQFQEVREFWDKYEVSSALHKLNDILKQANQYITEKQPWSKESTDSEEVLTTLFWCLLEASELYAPVFPEKARQAIECLKEKRKEILFPKIILVEESVKPL